jgi:VCBS repeat-containing protein
MEAELADSQTWLINNGFGPVYAFSYPFGDVNGAVTTAAGQYYKYGRLVNEGVNDYGGNLDLRAVMLWGNASSNSLTNVENYIHSAISQNKWVIVVCHGVVTDPNDPKVNSLYGWVTTDVLNTLLQFIKDNGVPVKTYAQLEGAAGPVNHAPVAVADSYATNANTTLTVAAPGVLGNDTDVDGNALTASLMTGVSHGTLTLNSNGSFTYVPAANYVGGDSFTYHSYDGALYSNTVTVTLTVTASNRAPVAVNNSYSTNEDTVLVVAAPGVLGNDTDADGDALTAALVTSVGHGTLTLNSNGSFTYTPAANYNGGDSFTYRANDGKVNSNTATVTLTVTAVNDAPVAVNDSYGVGQGQVLTVTAPGVMGNDTDVEGSALTATRLTGVAHGTLTFNSNGSFTYTPVSSYAGTDSFTYQVSDGSATSNIATVTITISPATGTTFGLNTTTIPPGHSWNDGSDVMEAQRFQNTAGTGTLIKLEMYFDPAHSPSGKARLAVYADNNGAPGARLLDAGEVNAASGWVSIVGLNLHVTANTYYWLVFNMNMSNYVVDLAGPDGSHYYANYAYGAFPTTFPLDRGYPSQWQYIMRATVGG